MSAIIEYVHDLFYKRHDPRTENWFMVSPGSVVTLCVMYLYFCLSAGPRYMRDKKPYSLRKTLIVYNFIQVLLSVYLLQEGLRVAWWNKYSYTCQPVDYSENPETMRVARAVYFYYMLKLVELLDTVFFILRKKERQVSTLHLYHHTLMPICAWVGVRFMPNGHPTLLGVINTFVHIVMYTYYMLSAFGPQFEKYLWWKKYITMMQLIQFVIVFVHSFQIFFNGCSFPKSIATLICFNSCVFIYMFSSFYVNTYIRRNKNLTAPAKKLENSTTNGATKNGITNGVARNKLD